MVATKSSKGLLWLRLSFLRVHGCQFIQLALQVVHYLFFTSYIYYGPSVDPVGCSVQSAVAVCAASAAAVV